MGKILLINTSPKIVSSDSRDLIQLFEKFWQSSFPQDEIIWRDIGAQPIPHIQGNEAVWAIEHPEIEPETEQSKNTRELSDRLIAEIKAADQIVLAVPMHNYLIPSPLLAYFHHIAVAGKTWGGVKYGANKQVLVITTGGGLHQDTEHDYQATYIKDFLKTIDLHNVTFIRAHGLCKSPEQRSSAIAKAKQAIIAYITDKEMKKISSQNNLNCQAQLLTEQSVLFKNRDVSLELTGNYKVSATPLL